MVKIVTVVVTMMTDDGSSRIIHISLFLFSSHRYLIFFFVSFFHGSKTSQQAMKIKRKNEVKTPKTLQVCKTFGIDNEAQRIITLVIFATMVKKNCHTGNLVRNPT